MPSSIRYAAMGVAAIRAGDYAECAAFKARMVAAGLHRHTGDSL
jgi:hypothetical protein